MDKQRGKEYTRRGILRRLTPARTIALGFCLLILAGTLLLLLPCATRSGQTTSLTDALFTATSASCVTGLVRFDTYTHWTLFGQLVILLLIQVGGIGLMTVALSFAMLMGRRIGLNQRIFMQESVAAPQVGGIVRMTRLLLVGTLLAEGLGTLLLAGALIPQFGVGRGLYFSVFHAISAFCNAGFDLMGAVSPDSSMITFAGNLPVNLTLMTLIIVGGLGFFVWSDLLAARFRFSRCRLHTKVVLSFSAGLILLGAVLFYLFERRGALYTELSQREQILGALFQSVSPRTAGFSSLPLARISDQSKVLELFLMLVGGSPGSTAGGMKTTTLAILVCSVYATFRRKKAVELFHRRIRGEVLRTAVSIAVFYAGLALGAALVISCLEPVSLMEALFETASAVATVGSSLGITAQVGMASKLILTFLMLVGRIGSVTFLLIFSSAAGVVKSNYPTEDVRIG